jgi:hypothetical protein
MQGAIAGRTQSHLIAINELLCVSAVKTVFMDEL